MATPEGSVYVTIDGFPLSTPGWRVTDHSSLFDTPDLIGGDRLSALRFFPVFGQFEMYQ